MSERERASGNEVVVGGRVIAIVVCPGCGGADHAPCDRTAAGLRGARRCADCGTTWGTVVPPWPPATTTDPATDVGWFRRRLGL